MRRIIKVMFRELRSHKWSLLFWSVGIVALVSSGMAKFAAYEGAGQSVVEIFNQFPKSVMTILGANGFDLTKASSFYGILFLYMALMGAVHAVLLGAGIIAKEERDRTSEFLFVRPITRSKIITGKFLAGLVNLIVLNLVTFLSSLYFIDILTHDNSFTGYVILLMTAMFILQLIFFFVGAMVAGLSNRPKSSVSMASSVLLVTFTLSFLVNLNEGLDFLKYLTPFKYYEANVLFNSMKFDPVYLLLSGIIIVVAITTTYLSYNRRDLKV